MNALMAMASTLAGKDTPASPKFVATDEAASQVVALLRERGPMTVTSAMRRLSLSPHQGLRACFHAVATGRATVWVVSSGQRMGTSNYMMRVTDDPSR